MINPITLLSTLRDEFARDILLVDQSVKRDYQFSDMPNMIQVAIGMRRTGKTFMLFQEIRRLLDEGIPLTKILYVNLEDDRLLPLSHTGLAELLDAFYALYPHNHEEQCYFFLDEIQNVSDWAIVVRRFLDSKKVKIYLSGSSAKLLSKEIASSLRGRSFATEIWPYHFAEYLDAHHIKKPPKILNQRLQDKYKQHLTTYLIEGGFPSVQSVTAAERRKILQDYADTVVYRDIIERYRISNVTLIKYLVKTMLNNAAATYSPNKFYNDLKSQGFKVSKDTVYDYINHIEDAFLAFTVSLYSESLRKTQVNPKKIYAVDSGLVKAYSISSLDNLGRMFENQFYIYLRKNGHTVYYYKTSEGFEIDFFSHDSVGKPHLYQVVWDTYDSQTLAREYRALESAEKELGIAGELIDPIKFLSRFAG